MPIIAVVNQKGGVGKTTLTVHLGVALARRGLRVVIVDGDPQGNTTSWLMDGDLSRSGLYDLLVKECAIRTCVRGSSRWQLGIVPGNEETANAMTILATLRKPFEMIRETFQPLRNMADTVLVDMPPSKVAGFAELLFACDWALVPTQLERFSLEGVNFMAATVAGMMSSRQQGPRLMGIVPNQARYVNEHREQLDELVKVYGATVWPPIPHSVRVAEASAFGTTLFDFAPGAPVTTAMELIVKRIMEVDFAGTRGKGR